VLKRRLVEYQKRLDSAAERCANAAAIELVDRDGRLAIVHRNTRPEAAPWRVTWIGTDGVPWGHSDAPTRADARREAMTSGYEVRRVRRPRSAPAPSDTFRPTEAP